MRKAEGKILIHLSRISFMISKLISTRRKSHLRNTGVDRSEIETKKDIRELFVYAFGLSQLWIYRETLERKARKDIGLNHDAGCCAPCEVLVGIKQTVSNFLSVSNGDVCTFFRAKLNQSKSRVWS